MNNFTFTSSATNGGNNILNTKNSLNSKPQKLSEVGYVKLSIIDNTEINTKEENEENQEGLGIQLELNVSQIKTLGILMGRMALKDKKAKATLSILKSITEIAETTQKIEKVLDNKMNQLRKEYYELSPETKEKYSSLYKYIEQGMEKLNIEEELKKINNE